jgi:hypothetical protein
MHAAPPHPTENQKVWFADWPSTAIAQYVFLLFFCFIHHYGRWSFLTGYNSLTPYKMQNNEDHDIERTRVIQAELVSGDTSGQVYMRLSEGGVAFLADRGKAEEVVSTKLRSALLKSHGDPQAEKE